jgi:tetratricopeptide (TPR) repeat protein
MRAIVLVVMLGSLIASAAHAADDVVTRAMKLYEKRHYTEAAAALRAELPALDPGRQAAAYLTLGMVHVRNGELHRALYQESLAAHLDYLRRIAAARGKGRSRSVDLYLGEALILSGKQEPALAHLERFLAEERLEEGLRAEAKAAAGLAHALRNNIAKADEVWAGLETGGPEAKAALAAAYAKAGLRDRKPAALADSSLAALKKPAVPSMRHLKNVLAAYAAAGQFEKGLETAGKADLRGFSYRETMGKTKVLSFYDASLLADLAQLSLQAGIAALEKAAEDVKLRETANFYLGEAYALAGSTDQSIRANGAFISSSMPRHLRDRATARQAANQYQKGKQFDAIGTWDDLSGKQPEDPDLLAEILYACGRLRVECPKVAHKAARSVEAGEGRRFSNLNVAVGTYYLARKDYAKGISYLENGRDKGNKNKIEANDPLMLVHLAAGYYRTKKFSEALEIYFEMSKQFPEVRQIQEVIQGIYAMEHKSAGDVKIN